MYTDYTINAPQFNEVTLDAIKDALNAVRFDDDWAERYTRHIQDLRSGNVNQEDRLFFLALSVSPIDVPEDGSVYFIQPPSIRDFTWWLKMYNGKPFRPFFLFQVETETRRDHIYSYIPSDFRDVAFDVVGTAFYKRMLEDASTAELLRDTDRMLAACDDDEMWGSMWEDGTTWRDTQDDSDFYATDQLKLLKQAC